MFYIVENERDLSRLKQKGANKTEDCFIDLITTNDLYHPKLADLVAIYIRPLKDVKGYIVPIDHDEGLNVELEIVQDIIKSYKKIYVLDKKRALYYLNLGKETHDLELKYAMLHYEALNVEVLDKTVSWFYNRYGSMRNINQLIPLVKLYSRSEELYSRVQTLIEEEEPAGFQYYNEYGTKVFFMIEQNGLRIDTFNFEKYFKPMNIDFSVKDEMVYTRYNMYNNTSRPTNSFNSVNFLAIPKGQEFRKCFKTEHGHSFVEFDFDGYHIRLVSEQIGYKLDPEIKAHKQLAKLWT